MLILELFSGTRSVGNVFAEQGWECVSLDLKNADITVDILSQNGAWLLECGYCCLIGCLNVGNCQFHTKIYKRVDKKGTQGF
jgi:hypothetical protein